MLRELKVRTALFGLVAGAGICMAGIVASIVLLVAFEHRQKAVQGEITGLRLSLDRLDIVLLEAREAEMTFMLTSDAGEVAHHAALMEEAHMLLDGIAASGEKLQLGTALAALSKEQHLLEDYEARFAELAALDQKIGLSPAEGLRSAMRSAVHDLEALLGLGGNADLTAALLMLRRHEKDFLLRNQMKYAERLSAGAKAFRALPEEAFGSAAQRSKALALLDTYQQRFAELVAAKLAEKAEISGIEDLFAQFKPVYEEISAALQSVLAEREARVSDVETNAVTGLITGAVIAMVVFVAVATAVSRALSRPLTACAGALQALAEGDIQTTSQSSRLSEIRQLSDALTRLTENEQDRRLMQDSIERGAQEQAHAVAQMGKALHRFAEGDLTCEISEPFGGTHDSMRQSFNQAAAKLRAAMTDLEQGAETAHGTSEKISAATQELSERTESQAATLEQSSAALDVLTAGLQVAAEGARETSEISNQARYKAEQGSEIVSRAVDSMERLVGASEQISQSVGVIDDIAFQTNLLALNAGVEAARAGDAGRGFAVVAAEVGSLAQFSTKAAKEIKEQISISEKQVEASVDLVRSTGQALSDILEQVEKITGLMEKTAASSEEQAAGLNEINIGVTELDKVTQHNALMVEESSRDSADLLRAATRLRGMVQTFRTSKAQPGRRPSAEVVNIATAG